MGSGELEFFASFIFNCVSAFKFCNSFMIFLIVHMHVFNHHFTFPRIHSFGMCCLWPTMMYLSDPLLLDIYLLQLFTGK